ncbi:MAG: glycosyltransferase [Dokdonella sp.]
MPTVSVIIPTYNRMDAVLRAVESVFACNYDSLEVIIVDDASTDGSVAALSVRYRNDDRVTLLRLKTNGGPSVARNHGLASARGELVLFLDSDDKLNPSAFDLVQSAFDAVPAMQFLALEGDEFVVVDHKNRLRLKRSIVRNLCPGWHDVGFDAKQFSYRDISVSGDSTPNLTLMTGEFLSAILYGDLYYLSGVFMRREAACAAGVFNPRFRFLEDWDFAVRLCMSGIGGYLGATGFAREIHRNDHLSDVESPWRRAGMHLHVLDSLRVHCISAALPLPVRFPDAEAAANYWFARAIAEAGHARLSRPYFVRALKVGYKPVKCMVRLLCSMFPRRRVSTPARRWRG